MKTCLNFLAAFILLTSVSFAQSRAKDYKTVKYDEKVFENDDYKLFIAGSFARAEVLKIKLRIFNKSKSLLYIKPEEISFVVNGKQLKGNGRLITVQPDGDETRQIDVSTGDDMRCETFDIILNGIYKVSSKNEYIKTENSEIDGKSGTNVKASSVFSCELKTTQSNKEKSFAKYSCVYTGDKIGVIEPNNTVAIMSSGKENFSSFPKNEIFVLEKNGDTGITIEFRKLNNAGDLTDGYKVNWDKVFHVEELIPYKAEKTTLTMDINKSE